MRIGTCSCTRTGMVDIRKMTILLAALTLSACSSSDDDDDGDTVVAPSSVAGQTYTMTIESGSGVFASTGQFTVGLSDAGDTYVVTGDGVNTNDSTGTYTYESSGNTGIVTFSDSAAGEGSYEITYLTDDSGSYVARLASDPATRQDGSFTQ